MEYELPLPNVNPLALQQAWQQVGYTLWQIQQLEATVGMYLVLVYKLEPDTARDEAEAVLEKTRRQSLGKLARELRTKPTASPGCQTMLLCGVTADPKLMMKVMHELLKARLRPYKASRLGGGRRREITRRGTTTISS